MTTLHNRKDKAQIYDRIRSLARFPEENPNAVLRLHEDGRLLYANPAAEPLLDHWHCDVGEQVPESITNEARQARAAGVRRPLVLDVGELTFYIDVTPVPETRYCNLYCRDITEQQTYLKRTRSLAKFPDENPNPVLRIDSNGTVLYANSRATKLLRTWRTETGGQVPGDIRTRVLEALDDGVSEHFEVECSCDDKPTCSQICTYLVELAPVLESGYANVYAKDITEGKQFRSVLSFRHEAIRDPLTKVLGACDLLGDPSTRDNADKLRVEVEKLRDAGRWLLSILDEVTAENSQPSPPHTKVK